MKIAIALLLIAQVACAENAPAFLFDIGAKKILKTDTGWATIDAQGKRRDWYKSAAGWSSGTSLYTVSSDGSISNGKNRYSAAPYGFSASGGRAIYVSQHNITLGTNSYSRNAVGYAKQSRP